MLKRIARAVWRQVILSGASMQGISDEAVVEDNSCHFPSAQIPVIHLTDTPWTVHGEEDK